MGLGGCLPPWLTGGVCVLDHAGLVFLSFFLQTNRRLENSGAGGACAWTPAQPIPQPDKLEPVPPWPSTYHIGVGEVETNKDIQVIGGQTCGRTRARVRQRGGPHGPDPCLTLPHLGVWAN